MSQVEVSKLHSLTGHRDAVYTLSQGPKPNLLFSGAGDGMVVLWNLENPEEGELIARLPNSIYSLLYVSHQNLLIAGQNYEGIHVLDPQEKKEVASLHLGAAAIFDLQIFEKWLLVASGDGKVRVVNTDTLAVEHVLGAYEKSARTIAVNRTRGEMAVGYSDNYIRIFSLADFKLHHEWQAHTNSVFTLSYTPDEQFLISGSRDARLKVWDTAAQYRQAHEVVAHLFAINNLVFSPDQKHFVTCSMDKSIKVWDAAEMKLLKVIDKARHAGHGTSVNKLLWTPFFNQLVSASDDRTISVWKLFFKLHTNKS